MISVVTMSLTSLSNSSLRRMNSHMKQMSHWLVGERCCTIIKMLVPVENYIIVKV